MSAYVVDPRTIDYIAAWATNHGLHHRCGPLSIRIPPGELDHKELPAVLEPVTDLSGGWRLIHFGRLSRDDLGTLLMEENVRSVRYRYGGEAEGYYGPDGIIGGEAPNAIAPDDLPGPVDQRRVWRYRFRPVMDVDPLWVASSVRCLRYQSCEHPAFTGGYVARILDAIEYDAVSALIERGGAPWGVTDEDLNRVREWLS